MQSFIASGLKNKVVKNQDISKTEDNSYFKNQLSFKVEFEKDMSNFDGWTKSNFKLFSY